MSLTSQNSTDYQYIEGVETVTFTPQNPAGTAVTTVKGLMQAVGGNPLINATLGIDPSDVTWHLWTVTLGGNVPKNGDLITSSSGSWIITSVGESARTGRFICQAKQTV